MSSRPIPVYPAFLKYPVSLQEQPLASCIGRKKKSVRSGGLVHNGLQDFSPPMVYKILNRMCWVLITLAAHLDDSPVTDLNRIKGQIGRAHV